MYKDLVPSPKAMDTKDKKEKKEPEVSTCKAVKYSICRAVEGLIRRGILPLIDNQIQNIVNFAKFSKVTQD